MANVTVLAQSNSLKGMVLKDNFDLSRQQILSKLVEKDGGEMQMHITGWLTLKFDNKDREYMLIRYQTGDNLQSRYCYTSSQVFMRSLKEKVSPDLYGNGDFTVVISQARCQNNPQYTYLVVLESVEDNFDNDFLPADEELPFN